MKGPEKPAAADSRFEYELNYRDLFDMSNDAIFVHDYSGRMLDANPRACEMIGYPCETILGMNMRDLYSEDSIGDLEKASDEFRRNGAVRFTTRLKKAGGSIIAVEISSRRIGDLDLVQGIVRDVTVQKKRENALRESEERFRAVFSNITVGIGLLDRQGRFLVINQPWARMLGYSPDEIKGRSHLDITHPDDIDTSRDHLQTLVRGKLDSYRIEKRYLNRDGNTIWGDVSVSPIRDEDGTVESIITVVVDITERKKIETALRVSEERFRLLYQNAPLPYQSLDEDGIILDVNPAWCRALGYDTNDVTGRWFGSLLTEACIDGFKHQFPCFKDEGRVKDVQFEMVSKEGKIRHVVFDGVIGYDHEGRFSQTHCMFRDVTERIEAEKKMKQLTDQLMQAQKMQAVGTLASGVAHDFNNILQVISGYINLAESSAECGQEIEEYLEESLNAVDRARKLVHGLLTFSRKVPSDLKPLSLHRSLESTIHILQRTFPRMIDIRAGLEAEADRINGDGTQLEQVVLNLCNNARDAMPGGGVLTIGTSNVLLDSPGSGPVHGLKPGRYVRLTIEDTGTGMNQETLRQVFDPFFTTKDIGKGTGIGLSMVYGIVKNHEGQVTCTSEPGKGTAFSVYFPALEPAGAETGGSVSEPRQAIPGGKETILLADDEATIRDVNRKVLERKGYTVLTAGTGEEALDIFAKEKDRVDLALLDLGMPGMGGLKCMLELLKMAPALPVVVASGYTADQQIREALKKGARGYLLKPHSMNDTLEKVRAILDGQAN